MFGFDIDVIALYIFDTHDVPGICLFSPSTQYHYTERFYFVF
jgi:hypothetical protein